jgi:hypothetical protein
MYSDGQDLRSASFSAAVGAIAGFAGGTGFATAVGAGAAGGGGAAAAADMGGAGSAGAEAALGAAGFGKVSLTTFWQFADKLSTFFCRQTRASLPPGEMPEQCEMKSERQLARSSLFSVLVTWAFAEPATIASASAAKAAETMPFGMVLQPLSGSLPF